MKLILTQEVGGLGAPGDVVEDKDGYGRNYLLPKGKATMATPENIAKFERAEFQLTDRNARGSADRIRATTEGNLSLDRVRYTTCPLGNEDWLLGG